jgi:hypothetical protein
MDEADHPTSTSLNAADEVTPLLTRSEPGNVAQGTSEPLIHNVPSAQDFGDRDEDETPLPVRQILLLCYARMVEPIAFFSIFPFINKMIYELGDIEESDVGFYSGIIVCISCN